MQRKEYAPEDFSWTRWTEADIARAADEVLSFKREALTRVKGVLPDERTFENTVYAIEASDHTFWKIHAINVLMNASPLQSIRDAAQQAVDRVEKESVDIEYDEDIYRALKEYESRKDSLSENLDAASEKLFMDMIRRYRRMGFDLGAEKQGIVKNNLKRLGELSSVFSKNINEHQGSISVTEEELNGLSEGYISGLEKDGDRYRVSLDYPELYPYLENATNASKRKELAEKSLQKGGEKNIGILKEIVALRDENARLLGYDNHGEFRLEVKMAKNAKTVFDFMSDVMERARGGVAKEMEDMKALKRRIAPNEEEEVLFYDIAFLAERLRRERFGIDAQKVREYFPLQQVLKGMFDTYERLFSVRFEKISDFSAWHEDIEAYRVYGKDGDLLSYFMLDLYPREGKYGHAAVFEVITGHRAGFSADEYTVPLACMLTNFPKPGAQYPSLLGHSEVVTLFHEFGHVMHEVLTTSRYRSQAGFNVAWDFAEAPSQMLENWAWDKDVLTRISGHYETGEPLPKDMIEKLIASKNHLAAYAAMRQMVMASFDMELHTQGVIRELNDDYAQKVAQYTGITLPKDQMFVAGWGHLMGYDAGYYGYMWSKVFAADMFSRFRKEGVMNEKTGMEYRKWILERGSSQDEMSLVEGFLGRSVDNEAFLREMGM